MSACPKLPQKTGRERGILHDSSSSTKKVRIFRVFNPQKQRGFDGSPKTGKKGGEEKERVGPSFAQNIGHFSFWENRFLGKSKVAKTQVAVEVSHAVLPRMCQGRQAEVWDCILAQASSNALSELLL